MNTEEEKNRMLQDLNCAIYFPRYLQAYVPHDCEEISLAGHQSNGVYSIYMDDNENSTEVYCDMENQWWGLAGKFN